MSLIFGPDAFAQTETLGEGLKRARVDAPDADLFHLAEYNAHLQSELARAEAHIEQLRLDHIETLKEAFFPLHGMRYTIPYVILRNIKTDTPPVHRTDPTNPAWIRRLLPKYIGLFPHFELNPDTVAQQLESKRFLVLPHNHDWGAPSRGVFRDMVDTSSLVLDGTDFELSLFRNVSNFGIDRESEGKVFFEYAGVCYSCMPELQP